MKLALFFTRGISLEYWLNSGLFEREKLIYEEHLKQQTLSEVFWFTYGVKDSDIAAKLQEDGRLEKMVHVVGMPKCFQGKIGAIIYSFLLPFICGRHIRKSDVLKTNQADGGWSALIAKLLYRKTLMVRTGYMLSFVLSRKDVSQTKVKSYELMERFLYRSADIGTVSSQHDKEYLTNKYNISEDKIKVLRNYVDTNIFRPLGYPKYPNRIIYVGRLSPEKNLSNLIEAISTSNLALDIYGKGKQQQELQNKAKKLEANVFFKGLVPNDKLPELLNRYRYYILPSLYEGQPKSLLEALSCGLTCIGTDVEGVNEIIQDQVNGYLCKTDANSIRDVISTVCTDNVPLNAEISKNARETILASYSLEKIHKKEEDIFGITKQR